jgi:hypothetical protein
MQGGQFFRFPVFQFPGPEILPRPDAPDAPDADVITAPTPKTHPGGRASSPTRAPQCHALGRFGVSPARTPSDPPRSTRGDSGVTSVKVRPHKRHNSLCTIIFSTIKGPFSALKARKGSVVGRFRPLRNGADKITLKILQLSRHKTK